MSTNSPASPTLQCKECSYENEPERVYCHNCGAKLDRSVLPKEEQIRRETPEKARKRISRMTNPGSNVFKREAGALVKTLISAVLAASLILAIRPPENVPPSKSGELTRLLASDLTDLVESPAPKAGVFTENELNAYLRSKKMTGSGMLPGVEFKRAYVDLEPSTACVVMERAVFGYPLYLGALYRVEGTTGVLTATPVGGNIGRLRIHPLIMERAAPLLFGSLGDALKREATLLKQMDRLVILKDRLHVVSKGKR
jgi:hypothetical protein